MATQKATKELVFQAANELQLMGEKPSSLKVYKKIQCGSFTTIGNYLELWRDEQEEPDKLDFELPDAVSQDSDLFIRKMWSVAKAQADEQIQIERDALSRREKELEEETSQAIDMANEVSERLETEQEKYNALIDQYNEKVKHFNELDKALSLLKQSLSHEQKKTETLERQLTESKEELTKQEEISLQSDKQIHSLENQVNKLREQLAATTDENAVFKKDNLDLIKENSKLSSRGQVLQDELKTVRSELLAANQSVTKLETTLEFEQNKVDELKTTNDSLVTSKNDLIEKLESIKKENQNLLDSNIEQRTEINYLKSSIDHLNAEILENRGQE